MEQVDLERLNVVYDDSHPACRHDLPADQPLTRIMPLPRVIELIRTRSLHLARVDRLSDPHDGRYPKDRGVYLRGGSGDAPLPEPLASRVGALHERLRDTLAVSCWHIGDTPSDRLWKAHSHGSDAIVVHSTIGGLCQGVHEVYGADPPERQIRLTVHGAKVRYVDMAVEKIPADNIFAPATFKSLEFAFEREFRLVTWPVPFTVAKLPATDVRLFDGNGIRIPVRTAVIVERVDLGPLATADNERRLRDALAADGLAPPVSRMSR